MRKTMTTKERAVGLLATRDHGVAELRRKLRQKGCPADEIDEALESLEAAGYLDDRKLLGREVERLAQRGYGPNGARQRLGARGFAASDVSEAIGEAEERGRFEEACADALRKRFGRYAGVWERSHWVKAARFLAGRGFRESAVRRALAAFEAEIEDEA